METANVHKRSKNTSSDPGRALPQNAKTKLRSLGVTIGHSHKSRDFEKEKFREFRISCMNRSIDINHSRRLFAFMFQRKVYQAASHIESHRVLQKIPKEDLRFAAHVHLVFHCQVQVRDIETSPTHTYGSKERWHLFRTPTTVSEV